jgi:hypothetical protein
VVVLLVAVAVGGFAGLVTVLVHLDPSATIVTAVASNNRPGHVDLPAVAFLRSALPGGLTEALSQKTESSTLK